MTANDREILISRLKEAGFDTKRFLKVGEDKAAFELEWQLNLYTPEELKNYPRWGIAGGDGLVPLEADKPEMVEVLRTVLPPTLEVISPRRQLPHFFFKIPDGEVPNRVLHLPNDEEGAGEIRAKNQYFVAAGTTIKFNDLQTGEQKTGTYKILNDKPIAEVAFADFMKAVTPYLGRDSSQRITKDIMQNGAEKGTRHAYGIKYATRLIRFEHLDPVATLDVLKRWNQKCKPPMNEKDLERMIKNALGYAQNDPQEDKQKKRKEQYKQIAEKEQIEKCPIIDFENGYFLTSIEDNSVLVKSETDPSETYYKPVASCYNKSVCGPRFRKKIGKITGVDEQIIVAKTLEFSLKNKDEAPETLLENEKGEDQKQDLEESAGFAKDGEIFEQIEEHKFVSGKNLKELISIEIDGTVYIPLDKQPWQLATKATPFEGLNQLRRVIKEYLREHLFLSEPALYDILTSWIIATWTLEIWTSVPYLFFYGPISSGKTRGLEILMHLAYRGLLSSNISPAALYRAIEKWKPTVLLDETEILSKETKQEIFGLLNSGYRKGQYAIRVKNTQDGCDIELFNVFGFKALAGTYGLKKATESRSVIVNTIKAGKVKVRRTLDEKKATEIRNMLLGYRLDQLADCDVSAVSDVFLDIGDCLDFTNGRMLELFISLISVAGEDKETIVNYVKILSKNKESEELAGEEAEIIQILSESDLKNNKNFISTNDISNKFNLTRVGDEVWGNRRIGWLMRKLGFNSKREGSNRGWVVNIDRLNRYIEIYKVKEKKETVDPPKKTAKTTETTEKGLEKFADNAFQIQCSYCKKTLQKHEVYSDFGKPYCKDCRLEIEAQKKKTPEGSS